ncbi:MAG: ribonuclease HII [Nitrospirae bacterium]|nr:MAG: ribonuclease HII [Nitrospirota bacterium]
MTPTHFFEDAARACGFKRIAGVDEAGRGPLAGPVVAAAVVLPRRFHLEGLDDSKELSARQRERLYHAILAGAIAWGVGSASPYEIDQLNILQATRVACQRAVHALVPPADFVLTDAVSLPTVRLAQRAVVKGDRLSVSIAAASILAKVTRDRVMVEYHQRFPQYHFHEHKGYPTPDHLRRLQRFGPCEAHRRSFAPVRTLLVRGEGILQGVPIERHGA